MSFLKTFAEWIAGEKVKFMEYWKAETCNMNWSNDAIKYHGEVAYKIYKLEKEIEFLKSTKADKP